MYKQFLNGLALIGNDFDIDLTPIIQQWCSVFESRQRCHGKKFAVKFCKELNTVGERYALHQNITAIPWTRSDLDGFPNCLKKFKRFLRSKDSRRVVLGLSVLRACEALRLPISKDISTVTAPCEADADLIADIQNFTSQWVKRIKRPPIRKLKYHFTAKNGPNGHALHESDSDISAVMNDAKLLQAIEVVQRKLKDTYPMGKRQVEHQSIHSKLTQFPEKAGKTRTIAIVDYYSQRCLSPLHEMLMKTLESLISDGTYSHQNVGKFAQLKTKDKSFIYCADLTAFTDRFPASIQRVLLEELIQDPELSQAWWTLLAERSFTVAWSGEQVTYACGQPMGAYASWPLCSLAHHLLIEYGAYKLGINQPWRFYRSIGDDVIITDRDLAQAYETNIRLLKVDINLSKTVCSPELSDYSGAEVAKQLYLNGTCLTPLTPGFVRNLKKPYMINSCMEVLRDRYEFFTPEIPPLLINTFFVKKKRQRLVWLLCSNPISGVIKPGNPGYDQNSPWVSLEETKRNDYYIMVVEQLLDKAETLAFQELDQLMSGVSLWKDRTRKEPYCMRPIRMDISKQLTRAIENLGDISVGADPKDLVASLDFIPSPFSPYMERKEVRQSLQSSAIRSLYDYKGGRTFVQLDW